MSASSAALYVVDICRMVKQRMKDAGLPARLSPHSFRVMTITDLLEQASLPMVALKLAEAPVALVVKIKSAVLNALRLEPCLRRLQKAPSE